MEELFVKIVSMSIQSTVLIMVVLLVRLLLRKAPKWARGVLWGMVAIRLVCPFSIESTLSLAPDTGAVNNNIQEITDNTQSNDVDMMEKDGESLDGDLVVPVKGRIAYIDIFSKIWLAGMLILLFYSFISYNRVCKCVKESIKIRKKIYICDRIDTPFILGIRRPVIYLPSGINKEQMVNVVAHEKAHLKRYDYIWKPLGFGILILHWFNPFCWLAYILFSKDIELACDEKVVENMSMEEKKNYSRVLLSLSKPRMLVSACPLAFGEVGGKGTYKKCFNL